MLFLFIFASNFGRVYEAELESKLKQISVLSFSTNPRSHCLLIHFNQVFN